MYELSSDESMSGLVGLGSVSSMDRHARVATEIDRSGGIARDSGSLADLRDGNRRMLAMRAKESARHVSSRLVSVLGVGVTDVSKIDAMRLMEGFIHADDGRCHTMFIVNAHTLNVASDQQDYRDVLNSADIVLNDGTGVRWAARQRGIELRANLVGTDLIPEFFAATATRGYRYFLLGGDPEVIDKAAAVARQRFSGWEQAGFHHGFVHDGQGDALIARINASGADVILVGMGNPIQERWIHDHQSQLTVPLAMGVGGLFDHWIDRPRRAPLWVRRAGCEWMHKLMLQPHKWRRYVLGNPKFIYRMIRWKSADVAAMQSHGGSDNSTAPIFLASCSGAA